MNIELRHKQHYDALCNIMQCIESYDAIETTNDELDRVNKRMAITNGNMANSSLWFAFHLTAGQRIQPRRFDRTYAWMQAETVTSIIAARRLEAEGRLC